MKMKTPVTVIIVALVSVGITYAVMNKFKSLPIETTHTENELTDASQPEKEKIAGLQTAFAVMGEGWDIISATGKVTVPPDRMVKITPRIAGKVVSARGTIGDIVSRGQVLAVISSIELAEARSQYRQALSKLKAAENNYERELHIVKLGANSTRPVEEARSESLSAQGELADAKSELAQAKSELTREQSELLQCKSRLDRTKELYVSKIVSKHDLETAEAEYKRDSALVDTAQSKVTQAEARIEKAQSKAEISKQYLAREEKVYHSKAIDLRSLQTVKNDIAGARIDVQAAINRIKILGASPSGTGENITVVSPVSGRIISRHTNIGEMASPESPLFTVANLNQVWIESDIYEKDLARVRKGQPVEIRVDTYPDKVFRGKVDSIGDFLSSDSRTAKIRCVVSNTQGMLRGEMFARISLITSKRGSTVLIPKQAILDDAGKKIVFTTCTECPEDIKNGPSACGEYDRAEVITGPVHGDRIEVLSGITPNTEVVTVGAFQLKTAMGSGQLSAGCADAH